MTTKDHPAATDAAESPVVPAVPEPTFADFDVDAFTHVARWDADNEWVEMRLRAGAAAQPPE